NNSTLTVTGAGTIQVQACQAGNTNYTAATCVTKSIVVNPAVLTVTADNKTMPYGGPLPSLTDSITGFVNGDTSTVVGGTATMTTTATTTSPAGGYPISFATKNLTASNYTFNYVNGTLTVQQAAGAITWPTPAPITYGSPLTPTQLDAVATCAGNTVPGTYVYTPALSTILNSGAQTLRVTFTPTDTASCPVESTTVPLQVNPAVLTVTADNKTMPYGGPLPSLTDSITGFVNGDTSAVVSGTATLSTTATTSSPAGAYPITFATKNLTASNYTFNYVPGTLTVQQGTGAITWPTPAPITYGSPLTPTQLDAVATCNGNTVAGSYVYTPALGAILAAGTQTLKVTFTPTDSASCPVETTTVPLVVNPAVLTVTADNKTMPYGGPLPTFTDTIAGYVNGDGIGVVSGSATMTTTATTTSPAGGYPISFATKNLAASNYTFNYVNGTLTVLAPVGAITWPTPAAINYGTPLSSTQLDAVATCNGIQVPGAYVYTPASGTILNAGTYTLKVTFTPTSNLCPVESTSVQLVVKKLPTTTIVTASTNEPNVNEPVKLIATVTGGLNETGTVVFTNGNQILCTATLNANGKAICSYTPLAPGQITVTATYSGDNNNLGSAGTKTLKICDCGGNKATVTLTAAQTQLTYPGFTQLTSCVALQNKAYPQGTISFYDGATLLGTVTIPTNNDCVSMNIPKPGLNVGQHPITAVFTDLGGNKTTSNIVVITVTAKATTMEASCWNSTFPYGGDYQCDANMDSGTKSGYMLYSLDGGTPVHLPLNSNGHTWFTIKKPAVGNHVVKIWYPAQGNFQGCGIPDNSFTVNPAPSQLALTPSVWSAKVGTDFKFTATITSWSAGAPSKDGYVIFYDGKKQLGKVKVNANGVAVLDAGDLCFGPHSITATYTGSNNFTSVSTNIQVQVNRN
ncbi:MAG: MBG domain-containing protein, partial [Terracidiphilus sp.]